MKLVITIDTEEDNWGCYSRTENSVENIKQIDILQKIFNRYKVKPTYLINYPIATNSNSIFILRKILEQNKCEIGMHCHPWNTPPFKEKISDVNSMLCNLPEQLIQEKLQTLSKVITQNFGVIPTSFRAGRWGFSPDVAKVIYQIGCRIDTSVSPFVNWSRYHGPDYSTFQLFPYRFDPRDIKTPCDQGVMMELPATVGFLQNNFERCLQWTLMLESKMSKKLHLKRLLHNLKLLNKVWLSPELSSLNDMIRLARRIENMNYPFLNMSFHSTSLLAGLSPFVQNRAKEKEFIQKIDKFLFFSAEAGFESVTLSQAF